ncbi:MAG: B12-binding domain-containing radical SAM protein, partial [Clostridia bacterium]|nr:B12-binding domain-containing radical SAM protein [Clostridia bacterium]
MKIVLFALNGSYSHTNLAVRAIGVSLQNAGCDTAVVEKNLKDTRLSVLEELVSHGADIYGFSTYIWNAKEMFAFA